MKSEQDNPASVNETPKWLRYERLVASLIANQLSTAYCVTPNAKIQGKISERSRQIDVLIDERHNSDNRQRIIVDAKARTRKIDVTHVEAFRGLMEDVEATHGYLICPHGYTSAAERRAQESVSIRLLPLDRLEGFDPSTWPKCLAPQCRNGRVFWDGYPTLDVMLTPATAPYSAPQPFTFVHYVGKCDHCSCFYVKCMSCGELFSPTYEFESDDGVRCRCQNPWFWLASIEEDDRGRKSAELHLVAGIDKLWTVDRRSI